jgi:hypothetical protein
MGLAKPYYRTARQFADGSYTNGGCWRYVAHHDFAARPSHYVRAFELLQDDLKELFKFVEPSDANLETYSFRTLEILLRASVEVEANCKAILSANTYAKKQNLNMSDYAKLEFSHYLSEYKVRMPYWSGNMSIRQPFKSWASTTGSSGQKPLDWYQRYNSSKHDRAGALSDATLEAVIDAVAGVFVLLTAQFLHIDFAPGASLLAIHGVNDGFKDGLGGYFRVAYPPNIPMSQRYDFDWDQVAAAGDPFERFDYDSV